LLILLIPALLSIGSLSYSSPVRDSLEMAKNLRKQGKYKDAYKLLRRSEAGHPHDLNITWLYAQTALWTGHIAVSEKAYADAMRDHPGNYYLMLDYARMLVEIGEYSRALPLISAYLKFDPESVDANLLMGKMDYYKSQYPAAKGWLDKVISKEPENQDAGKLRHEIYLARSPHFGINGGFTTDDQPMTTITPSVVFGLFLHTLSDLHITLAAPIFQNSGKTREAYWLSATNTAVFPDSKTSMTLGAGILRYPSGKKMNWTGNFGISKTLIRQLDLGLEFDRAPYFYTLSSIDTSLMQNHAALSLAWNESKTWTGRLTIEGSKYSWDHHNTYGFNFWGFAPPLKLSVFEFRIGYGFNYSTANQNRFTSQKTLQEILTNFDSAAPIKGVYNPYFTPKDQQVHSVLGSVDFRPSKSLLMGISANYGFYATARIPYLYLNTTASGFETGFLRTAFHPVEASAFAEFRLSEQIHLKLEYKYRKTYYYTSNYAGFGLNINFCNDRKKK